MKALCKEVEALLLGAMRPAVAETLGDDQANLDDLAEEVRESGLCSSIASPVALAPGGCSERGTLAMTARAAGVQVLDRCKETLLPFCDELKTRPNESFAPNVRCWGVRA